MVHRMDRGRYYQPGYPALDIGGQSGIAVVENRNHQDECLEQDYRLEGDVQENDDDPADQCRKQHLAEVEAKRTARIERLVQMVHLMEAPEEGDLVVGAMPPIDPKVENQQIEQEALSSAPPVGPETKGEPGREHRDRRHQDR